MPSNLPTPWESKSPAHGREIALSEPIEHVCVCQEYARLGPSVVALEESPANPYGPGRDRTCDLGIKSGRLRLVRTGERYVNGFVEPNTARTRSGALEVPC